MSTLSLGEGALHHAVQGRSPPSLRCTQCQSESSECAVQLNPNCKVIQTDAGQQLSLCTNQAQRAQRKGLVTVWTWGLRCGCGEPRPPLAVSPQVHPQGTSEAGAWGTVVPTYLPRRPPGLGPASQECSPAACTPAGMPHARVTQGQGQGHDQVAGPSTHPRVPGTLARSYHQPIPWLKLPGLLHPDWTHGGHLEGPGG